MYIRQPVGECACGFHVVPVLVDANVINVALISRNAKNAVSERSFMHYADKNTRHLRHSRLNLDPGRRQHAVSQVSFVGSASRPDTTEHFEFREAEYDGATGPRTSRRTSATAPNLG